MNLNQLSELCQNRLERLFTLYITHPHFPATHLQQAISYAVQNGGKRIRPLLVFASGIVFNGTPENLEAPACAIELIHTYSLIHDDLPAMDNSDLRRGKPSCHKAYDEATAILAGDALQPLAFEIIGSHPSSLTATQRLQMIKCLSVASGMNGMAAGQALDLAGVTTLSDLDEMYTLKTGALLTASVELGLIASDVKEIAIITALKNYIQKIGLAFQLQDDLLDVKSTQNITGKPQGLDILNEKITYLSLLGIEKTQEKIQALFENALTAIEFLGKDAEILRELAYHLLHRKN